jgi:tyrosine-specific transport protein
MNIIYAIAILSGTIIGAGLFALPYITLKLGLWVIFGYFLVLGALAILIHLLFGKLALKTPDFKRLPGFAKIYLGRKGEIIAYVSTILSLFGALLAYLILGGEFLTELLSPIFGGSMGAYVLFYFIIGAALIFFGIKAISKVEFWGLILFFAILLVIFLKARPFIEIENLFLAPKIPDWSLIFLPYGVILFALWGAALIPEIEEMLGKQKKAISKIIPIAILISVIIYLFFTYLILGITGAQTTESALTGLRIALGNGVITLALLFGLLTTFTSFITLGLTLKKVFWYDLKFTKNLAWVITCFIPLFLYLAGFKSFIAVIGAVGGIMLAIDGILILLMYKKSEPKSWFVYPSILLLLGGIIYSIIYFS